MCYVVWGRKDKAYGDQQKDCQIQRYVCGRRWLSKPIYTYQAKDCKADCE